MDVFDVLDFIGGSGSGGDIFSGGMDVLAGFSKFAQFLQSLFSILGVVSVIGLVVMAIAAYIFNSWCIMLIGQKMGLDRNWMPYVPVARAIYRLRIIGEQWWKQFFLELWWLYGGILALLLTLIHGTFAAIMLVAYLLCCIGYNIYYRFMFYRTFNINPYLIIGMVAGVGSLINLVVDVLIGCTELLPPAQYQGSYFAQPVRQAPQRAPQPPRPSQQPPMQQNVPPPVQQQMAGPCSITCVSGMYAGNRFNMNPDEELIIGRDASVSNIILSKGAEKVSRKHVGICFNSSSQTYYVTDYSTNGTMTRDGARLVANMPTSLPSGTVLCLGNNENTFRLN